MSAYPFLSGFPFDHPEHPVSLYDYAPVFRVVDRSGAWVVKRTGLAHSSGEAIGAWLASLRRGGVAVVAPVDDFAPNPRMLDDGFCWVVYPYVTGEAYTASEKQIRNAGSLLGQMHAAELAETTGLATHFNPVLQSKEWLARHEQAGAALLRQAGYSDARFRASIDAYLSAAVPVEGLPLAGCSCDFKASNLVFAPEPVLVDPDHAARAPRLYDLAVAALLFHNDAPTAPARLWSTEEWKTFMSGYDRHVSLTPYELSNWVSVLRLAWLDQGVWLVGNFPEGWAEKKKARYLFDLATINLDCFHLP
jgi:spectinomycin phosphotransferase